VSELIGNTENIKRLTTWLTEFKGRVKAIEAAAAAAAAGGKKGKASKNDFKRAVLISGPPGIGKSTAATMVSESLGFDVREFNASSTRNKGAIEDKVRALTTNHAVGEYYKGASQQSQSSSGHQVLVMDECDGMSSSDRGGIQAIISIIETTQVPIICICNDREKQNIRTLVKYCIDLKFERPKTKQMTGRMMQIAFKEGMNGKVNAADMMRLCESAGQDVRQMINVMQMARSNPEILQSKFDGDKCKDSKNMLGPYDAIWPLFNQTNVQQTSLNERSDMYFVDYSFVPMIIQENYLSYTPVSSVGIPNKKRADLKALEAASRAADSISLADIQSGYFRGAQQNWSLLPHHAISAAVAPGFFMQCSEKNGGPKEQGWGKGKIAFPQMLGKISNYNKRQRILVELQARTRQVLSADRISLRMDYMESLRRLLTAPLLKHGVDGIEEALVLMERYSLTRDDYDTLEEVQFKDFAQYPNLFAKIPTNVKSGFTRAYNNKQQQISQKKAKGAKGKAAAKGKGKKAPIIEIEEKPNQEADADIEEADDDDDAFIDF